jgi:hypothetical protein
LSSDLARRLDRLDRRFHRIKDSIEPFDLQRVNEDQLALDFDDLFGSPAARSGGLLFMGYYGVAGVEAALERYGILKQLQARGIERVKVVFDLSDTYVHTLRIHDAAAAEPVDGLLSELRVRRLRHAEEPGLREVTERLEGDFLLVEWLMLQNPHARFTQARPRLPGQEHPGLGIGPEVFELIQIMAERLGLNGVIQHPMHFHNATLAGLRSQFVDPTVEGRLRALIRDLRGLRLSEASWAVDEGAVIDGATGAPVAWEGREQLFPLHREVARYFESSEFVRKRDLAFRTSHFRVDDERMAEVRERLAASHG